MIDQRDRTVAGLARIFVHYSFRPRASHIRKCTIIFQVSTRMGTWVMVTVMSDMQSANVQTAKTAKNRGKWAANQHNSKHQAKQPSQNAKTDHQQTQIETKQQSVLPVFDFDCHSLVGAQRGP
jgi:hypothetical protein